MWLWVAGHARDTMCRLLMTAAAALVARDQARYPDPSDYWRQAKRLLSRLPSGDASDRWRAQVLIGMGDAHRRECRYPQAVAALTEAKQLLETGDRAERAAWHRTAWRRVTWCAAVMALGVTAKERGRLAEAEDWYVQVAQVQERWGAGVTEAAALEHNLAGLAHARRDYPAAERHAREAVRLRRSASDTTAVDVAQDVAVLAAAVAGQGRLDEAYRLFHDAMAACSAACPPRAYEVGVHLHNLAAIEHERGAHSEAERLYLQALDIKRRLLGPDHPEVALAENNFGTLLRDQGRTVEAADHYRHALAVVTRVDDGAHPLVRVARENLDRLATARDTSSVYKRQRDRTPEYDRRACER